MKNRKILMVLISLAAAAILLAGCAGNSGTKKSPVAAQNSIEGKWMHPDMGYQKGVASVGSLSRPVVYEFTKDGKILMDFEGESFKDIATKHMTAIGIPEERIKAALDVAPEMTYTLEEDRIIILTKTGEDIAENSGPFTIEKDTLTLPDFGADTLILTRVK